MIYLKPPPSMHELDRAADRILDVKLPALFALPLLPAVVFSSWGVDWSKQEEPAAAEASDSNSEKVKQDDLDPEEEDVQMALNDHSLSLFISISASLAFSKMDYESLVSNSLRLSQFRVLLQSLLSTASCLPLSSVTVNAISRGSVIVSVTFDFPSSAYSYPEAKAVVQGIIMRAGEIFSGSFAKEFSHEPPEISLFDTHSHPHGQDGPLSVREEEEEDKEEKEHFQFNVETRKSEDGVGHDSTLKVPMLSLPTAHHSHHQGQGETSHRSDTSVTQALMGMAGGSMAKAQGEENIGLDLDDSTLQAAAMALTFFEERRSKSLRRMEQDVVDSILLLRGEQLEGEEQVGDEEQRERERKRREDAPSPFDNWLQDATPRAGIPTDGNTNEDATNQEGDDSNSNSNAYRKTSRLNSKFSKFTPSSQQVDIFLGEPDTRWSFPIYLSNPDPDHCFTL